MSQADIIPDEVERDLVLEYGIELEIAALKGSHALTVLLGALQAAEEEWAKKVGFNVLTSTKPVDQRKLDYTRGYFAGARHYLMDRVSIAQQRVASYEAKRDGRAADDPRPTGQPDPRTQRSEDA